MQDYGGPVGLRLAVAHPDRVRGFIVQNAVASVEGWNPDAVAAFAPFWNNRTPETEAPIRRLLTAETTRFQYTQGASRPERLSPDAWVSDQAHLDRPGNADLQLAMLFDYQDNIAHYPVWKAYLETARPPMLIVWDATIPSSGRRAPPTSSRWYRRPKFISTTPVTSPWRPTSTRSPPRSAASWGVSVTPSGPDADRRIAAPGRACRARLT